MRHWLCLALLAGCGGHRDPAPAVIHARFDPDDAVIPMPSDVLRDDANERLDIPLDDEDLTDAERELYTFFNTLDGWSSAMPATLEFTGEIDATSVTPETLQVWELGDLPRRVDGLTVTVAQDGRKLTIDAPRAGWTRGGQYVVLARGGESGLRGLGGEKVECDAAFYFLRLDQPLDVPEHERAFPGDTAAERRDNARKLEEIRLELAPYFDMFEASGIPRSEVAALWRFTITERVELAMDKASQRMPIPFDLLLDPETGHVDLPAASWDSPTVVEAKRRLAEYDGFGTSIDLMLELTGPIDPATVTPDAIRLYDLSGSSPRRVNVTPLVLDTNQHIILRPGEVPLEEQTRYGVVFTEQVKDPEGRAVIPMPVGQLMRHLAPVAQDGASLVGAVDDADAARVEATRQKVVPLLEAIGRDAVVTAWPFTTMSIREHLLDLPRRAETLQVSPEPTIRREMTPGQAVADFPIGALSMFQVGRVFEGTILSPVYLDPITRGWRDGNTWEPKPVTFTMTIPEDADPNVPIPVVIFGHGIMTERRFVLAIADSLASRGFAAVSIDFPYHGERTACAWQGPLCYPDTISGEEICPDPCPSGATCSPDGLCRAGGEVVPWATWPILEYPQASGAAFIEVEAIANTRDHFRQAFIDLGALSRSIRTADWESAIGYRFRTDQVYYVGQSLGGIIGATYATLDPTVKKVVLNVPGGDSVDLFSQSPVFGGHVDLFLQNENIEPGSYDEHRFMNVARWFVDAVDPMNQASFLPEGRDGMIQMALGDFIILNEFTLILEELSGLPRRDYAAEHAFLVIPVEPEYGRGVSEMAGFFAGTFTP